MDYKAIYNRLIETAITRPEPSAYVERHRIIPGCMKGTYASDNVAVLTYREHFVAHLLLTKIYPDNAKVAYAAWSMACRNKHKEGYKVTSRIYQTLRERNSENQKNKKLSEETKDKIREANIGRKHTEEAKAKISKARQGKKGCTPNEETRKKMSASAKKRIAKNGLGNFTMKGKQVTEETKAKMREARIGKIISDETKSKISKAHKGRKFDDEHKRNLSLSHQGHTHSNTTRKKLASSTAAYWQRVKEAQQLHPNLTTKEIRAMLKNNHFVE